MGRGEAAEGEGAAQGSEQNREERVHRELLVVVVAGVLREGHVLQTSGACMRKKKVKVRTPHKAASNAARNRFNESCM